MDDVKLDEGFQEVSLDDGFEEVPLDESVSQSKPLPKIEKQERKSGFAALPEFGMEGFEPDTAEQRAIQQKIVEASVDPVLFNTLPAIAGAGEGLKSALKLSPLEEILKNYQQGREQKLKEIEQTRQDYPTATTAGSIATSLAAAPLMLQGVGLANAVGVGAGTGAASALGQGISQNQDISDIGSNIVKDALLGAGIGIAGEAGMGMLKGAGKVSKAISESDLGQAFSRAKAGESVTAENYLPKKRSEIKDFASSLMDKFQDTIKVSSEEKRAILKDLTDKGVKVDTLDVVKNLANDLGSANLTLDEAKDVQNAIQKIMSKASKTSSPLETETLIKDIRDMGRLSSSSDSYNAIKNATDKIKTLQDSLDDKIPQLNKNIFENIETSEALLKANPTEYMSAMDDLAKQNYVSNLIEKLGEDYKVQSNVQDILEKGAQTSKKQLSPLKELNPEIATMLEQKAQKLSKDVQLGKAAKESILEPSIMGTAKAAISKGQVVAGDITGKMVKSSQDFLKDGAQTLSKADGNSLQKLGSKIAEIGGTTGQEFANVLAGLEGKSEQSKNAIVFSLMQQPGFRELFNRAKQQEVENGSED